MISMDNIDILELPEMGQSINVRILSPPRKEREDGRVIILTECLELGSGLRKNLVINSSIYKGMLLEFIKNKITIDDGLKCMVGCIFTITTRPIRTWSVVLRKDLMRLSEEINKAKERNEI